MQSSPVSDHDNHPSMDDSLADGSCSEEDKDVEYEEIEVEEELEEEVESDEEIELEEEVQIEDEMEGQEEVKLEEQMEMEEDDQIQEEEEEEILEEEIVEEEDQVQAEKEVLKELSDSQIKDDRKGHLSTRHVVELTESVYADIAQTVAPINGLEHEDLVTKPKSLCYNELRQNEDPLVNNMGEYSTMKHHLVAQGNKISTLVGGSKNYEGIQEREGSRDDIGDGVQTSFYESENMVPETIVPLPFSVGVVDSVIFRNEDLKESNAIMDHSAKVHPLSTQSGLHVRETRPRSLSPADEFKDGNKRPTLICDFFALGWCIKGSSCRFLHVKDHTGAIESSMHKKELQSNANEGFGRSGSSEFSSDAHGSYTLERVPPLEQGGSTRKDQISERALSFKRDSSKDMTEFGSSNASSSMMPNFGSSIGFAFNPPELTPPKRECRTTINNVDRFQMKSSLYDWEPSVPFQPSFIITRSLLRASLYDPIRDCIEQPTLSGTSYRVDVTMSNSCQNREADNKLSDRVGQQYGYGIDKTFDGQELFLNEKEDTSSSHAGPQSTVPFALGEKTCCISVKDNGGDMTSEVNTRRPEMDANDTIQHQQDLKTQKYFRASLIEFIKELVKPAWREGRLTKTAHKVIVKTTVEKVLNEENQFPNTEDSIQQFLTASQPKLSKLVAGYIIKYGKS